jgi:hypothetical protein
MLVAVRRRLPVAAIALAAALLLPVGVIASHQFTDVPTSSSYHTDIDAIRDAGVTTGCTATLYCPKDFVTREQMAAFLNRLGALGPGKTPVVNADKVDGVDDVLAAADIRTSEIGTWHQLPDGSGFDLVHNTDEVTLTASSDQILLMRLHGPDVIGGTAYGFKSARLCYSAVQQASTVITNVQVVQSRESGIVVLINDSTVRAMTTAGCFTVTDPSPTAATGGTTFKVAIDFTTGDSVRLRTTTTTWTPVS